MGGKGDLGLFFLGLPHLSEWSAKHQAADRHRSPYNSERDNQAALALSEEKYLDISVDI